MNEWDEVAESLLPGYLHWADHLPSTMCNKTAVREYVRQKLIEESEQLRDNVSDSLYALAYPGF